MRFDKFMYLKNPTYALDLRRTKWRYRAVQLELELANRYQFFEFVFPNKLVDAWEIMKARNFSQIPVFDERDRAIGSVSESFLATYVATEYGLDRRIDEVEVEDTFPLVGRNTAASTVADILKTKQAVWLSKRAEP